MTAAVKFEKISKAYGTVQALQHISLTIPSGSMHAIVGENGAGKTTLMRVLNGLVRPDSGTLYLDNNPTQLQSAAEATRMGVGMVSQHYGIIPELTCLQNLILGAEPSSRLNSRVMEQRAQNLADRMGFEFAWKEEAVGLSPSSKQKLEILKLLWRESKIMILDEPTAMLSPADSAALFHSMNQLVLAGTTVLLVTHRVREVLDHCKKVAVLRAGQLVADLDVDQTSDSELSSLIIGAAPTNRSDKPKAQNSLQAIADPVLTLTDICVKGERGENALSNVSLKVFPGEIVGIAGVDGNGQHELMHMIAGSIPPFQGSLSVVSENEHSDTRTRLKAGMRLIPEDRQSEGAIEPWTVEENTVLGIQFLPPLADGKSINASQRHILAQQIVDRFHTRQGGLSKPMATLSGGNQQRLVVARALCLNPRLLIAFQPVRGLDIGATAAIYDAITQECANGMAALIVSFDLDELISHCNRILVLNQGVLFTPPPDKILDRATIGDLMVGV